MNGMKYDQKKNINLIMWLLDKLDSWYATVDFEIKFVADKPLTSQRLMTHQKCTRFLETNRISAN